MHPTRDLQQLDSQCICIIYNVVLYPTDLSRTMVLQSQSFLVVHVLGTLGSDFRHGLFDCRLVGFHLRLLGLLLGSLGGVQDIGELRHGRVPKHFPSRLLFSLGSVLRFELCLLLMPRSLFLRPECLDVVPIRLPIKGSRSGAAGGSTSVERRDTRIHQSHNCRSYGEERNDGFASILLRVRRHNVSFLFLLLAGNQGRFLVREGVLVDASVFFLLHDDK
mmetsp:Transcript_22168/g.35725  ORF Transcript_22168/g.35725 Transcript_22168/m.35725 type:complete len:220 (-) Transcript_22168:141-800(-)